MNKRHIASLSDCADYIKYTEVCVCFRSCQGSLYWFPGYDYENKFRVRDVDGYYEKWFPTLEQAINEYNKLPVEGEDNA
jgi:hypothetical protein